MSGSYQKEVGFRIKKLRNSKSLTLDELGKISGIHRSTINRIENGTMKTVSIANICIIASALGVDQRYIFCANDYIEQIQSIKNKNVRNSLTNLIISLVDS